jgi:hypothetical protein
MAMQADMLHSQQRAGHAQLAFERVRRSCRPAIKAAATIRQHHAGSKSAALDRPGSSIRPKPFAPHAADITSFGSSGTSASNTLLLPQATGFNRRDLACSDDMAQQAQHVDAAELALLQELVQDAQQLQELLERHPEVLQAQHPSPLQAWVSTCSDDANASASLVAACAHHHQLLQVLVVGSPSYRPPGVVVRALE